LDTVNARIFRARNIGRCFAAVIFAATWALPLPSYAADNASVFASRHMVSAANSFAARAGRETLRRGGSAVDAAIAVQMVLNLVEPQSSGIGGGAFMLHYDAADRSVQAYDGRETAPAAATPELFLDETGKPLGFFQALVGGRAVGAPGVLRMLELAHQEHGLLPWRDLFRVAITLSEDGFPISPRLHGLIVNDKYLATYPDTRRHFYEADGTAKPVGRILRNPALAATFRRIASEGADAFYEGAIARSIVLAVRSARDNPGLLSQADLANYEAKSRAPVCGRYWNLEVCGMPPPTSGGVTTLQILGMLQRTQFRRAPTGGPLAAHYVAEASRLAFADRDKYLADADFIDVPVTDLLDQGYLRQRARLISRTQTMATVAPGTLPKRRTNDQIVGTSHELPSTTHFSIVDERGNAVSMTSSVENVFGSRLMVGGFLLNNQLTDFSFAPEADGAPVANRVQPGKRPRSSMSPFIVLDRQKQFRMAVGSPGGSRIIGYVAKTLIGVIEWRLDIQSAIDLPNLTNRGRATEVELRDDTRELVQALAEMGHTVRAMPMTSGIHGIVKDRRGLWGGADRRREGIALGD
jgi:gamma-glutamyltranspeptidase/glutathione hydrolase